MNSHLFFIACSMGGIVKLFYIVCRIEKNRKIILEIINTDLDIVNSKEVIGNILKERLEIM